MPVRNRKHLTWQIEILTSFEASPRASEGEADQAKAEEKVPCWVGEEVLNFMSLSTPFNVQIARFY